MDYLVRTTAADGAVRAFAAVTTELCEEARRRHDLWPTAAAALGRALTGTVIMGTMLGPGETVLLQIMGDGPVSPVVAWADSAGHVRGYVSDPHVHLPITPHGKLDVAGAVGSNGVVHVIRDVGLKEPYHGTVPIISGEIGLDLANYFLGSEQIPSAVGLGVLVDTDNSVQAAGGFIVQVLPGASADVIDRIEQTAGAISSVTGVIASGQTPEDLLERLLDGVPSGIPTRQPLQFLCGCSRERFTGYLVSLGIDELERLSRDGGMELRCHFCNEAYYFDPTEVQRLIDALKRDK